MKRTLTEEDINSLKYFWQETGDLERLSTFEALKPILEKENPKVIKAWNNYKSSESILDAIINNL